MKTLYYLCAMFLFLTFLPFPIEYYYLLRVIVTLGAITILLKEYKHGITFWFTAFTVIAFLFNPIFPIYLGLKSLWLPFDITAGILFLLFSFRTPNDDVPKEDSKNDVIKTCLSTRDHYPNSKNTII